MIKKNPDGDFPKIHNTAYIDFMAAIIGKVIIGKSVFVGPGAVLRADEPNSSIIIGDNCNIQDRVIIHALENTSVVIDKEVSLAHGCIVHGPCKIGNKCFIGFGAIVFNSILGEYVMVKHSATVEGVKIPNCKMVSNGMIVDAISKVSRLRVVPKKFRMFIEKVIKTNLRLVSGYKNV